jgi:hypothetical protein
VLDVQNLTSTVQLLLSEVQKQNLELQELRNQIQELKINSHKLKINNHNQIQELRQSHRVEIDQLSRDNQRNQRHHQMTVQEFELVIIELRRNQRGDVLPFRRPRGEQMVDAPDWLSAEQQGSLEEKHAEHLELFLPRRQPSPAPPTDDEDEEEVL